jgi:hypothetical protein
MDINTSKNNLNILIISEINTVITYFTQTLLVIRSKFLSYTCIEVPICLYRAYPHIETSSPLQQLTLQPVL